MSKPVQILLIEDSEDDKDLLLYEIKKGGINAKYLCIQTAEELKKALDQQDWDIILSDYSMPTFDGLTALRMLKDKGLETPFILISGTVGEDLAVEAMKAGAEDYIMKDNLRRLVPAMYRELRDAEVRKERRKAITALKQSEEKFKKFFNDDLTGNFITSVDGTILLANPALARIFGYESVADLMKVNFKEFYLNPDERADFLELISQKKQLSLYETQHIKQDGTIISVIKNVIGVFDTKGKLIGMKGYLFDNTEQKRIEEALKENELKYRTLVEQSPDGIFISDLEGKFISVNKSICDILLFTEKELLNMNIWDIIPAKYLEQHKARLVKILSGEKHDEPVEYEVKDKIGNFRYIEVLSAPYYKNKKLIGFQGIARDTTERKKSTQVLHRLNQAISNSREVIFMTDKEGILTYINPEFTRMYGYKADEVIGKSTPRILKSGHHPENQYIYFWQRLLNKQSIYEEYHNKCKDGRIVVVEASADPILDERGEIIGFLGIQRNIDERKHTEKELVAAKLKAEESDRLKSAFLANMSHEIRTPMNGIMGFAELLKEPALSSDDKNHFIEIIERSGRRMLNIINDIIDISKIESGTVDVLLSETNVNEQIDFIYNFFTPEIKQKGIQFISNKALTHEQAFITSDREKLYAVLTNLVKNAIKFTNEGTIEIGYTKKESFLEFYVKDTGKGLKPEQELIIFERFRQGSESLSRDYEGAGLGLSISKAYVEMLGGKIWFKSKPEQKGSEFFFTLPINK
jgi:hypothetical protein